MPWSSSCSKGVRGNIARVIGETAPSFHRIGIGGPSWPVVASAEKERGSLGAHDAPSGHRHWLTAPPRCYEMAVRAVRFEFFFALFFLGCGGLIRVDPDRADASTAASTPTMATPTPPAGGRAGSPSSEASARTPPQNNAADAASPQDARALPPPTSEPADAATDSSSPPGCAPIDPPAPPVTCAATDTGGAACIALYNPCEDPTGNIKQPGARCENGSQCVTYDCAGGVCLGPGAPSIPDAAALCRIRGSQCQTSSQCLHHDCVNGLCGCSACLVGPAACKVDYDCCSLRCRAGVCAN
jgi:hypothetical protein